MPKIDKTAQITRLLDQAREAQNESKGDPEVGHGQIDGVLLELIKTLAQGTPYEWHAEQIRDIFYNTRRWYA